MVSLAFLKPLLEVIKIGIEKAFPSAEEKKQNRKEKAKEAWDSFVKHEKEIEGDEN